MTLDQKGLALNGCFKLYMPPSLMLQIFIRLYLPIPASEWQVLELSFNGGGMVKQIDISPYNQLSPHFTV